jgi:glycine/D-amino acid oxidase-like deaminating enzyme
MRKIGDHAVVLGAGIAGPLAARVVADAYEHVTVVERDPLPEASEYRRGVQQPPTRLLRPSMARRVLFGSRRPGRVSVINSESCGAVTAAREVEEQA